MRVHICAVGRLRAGAERDLISDYLQRFDRTGRALGLGPARILEIDERRASNKATQAGLLRRAIPRGAWICVLDERGKNMTSPDFANLMAIQRDSGRGDAAFVIGGADGLDHELRAQADAQLSFGAMVWPHMFARIMLSEQLYRAATIMSGSPYHRN